MHDRAYVLAKLGMRAANLGPLMERIIDILEPLRPQMHAAADKGLAPAMAISRPLIDGVGLDALSSVAAKSAIGVAIHLFMNLDGYEVDRSGVKLPKDPLFVSGSTYRRALRDDPNEDIVFRFLSGLTSEELRRVQSVARRLLARRDKDGV